jgi:hypothetical protein
MLSVWLLCGGVHRRFDLGLRSSLNGRPVCSSYSRAITFTLVTNVFFVGVVEADGVVIPRDGRVRGTVGAPADPLDDRRSPGTIAMIASSTGTATAGPTVLPGNAAFVLTILL